MTTTPSHDDTPHGDPATARPTDGFFTEVPVYPGILDATADTLELLHDFFTDTDPAMRTRLGRFLVARQPDEDAGDPSMEAHLLLHELTEAADLLHTLAGRVGEGPMT
jgi:hypothetical protein